MGNFLLLRQDDLEVGASEDDWEAFVVGLNAAGVCRFGSWIGAGNSSAGMVKIRALLED